MINGQLMMEMEWHDTTALRCHCQRCRKIAFISSVKWTLVGRIYPSDTLAARIVSCTQTRSYNRNQAYERSSFVRCLHATASLCEASIYNMCDVRNKYIPNHRRDIVCGRDDKKQANAINECDTILN